jgi:hypothetical protein
VDITYTAISQGVYDLYAKIGGTIPKVISTSLQVVVEVLVHRRVEFGEITFNSYAKV